LNQNYDLSDSCIFIKKLKGVNFLAVLEPNLKENEIVVRTLFEIKEKEILKYKKFWSFNS